MESAVVIVEGFRGILAELRVCLNILVGDACMTEALDFKRKAKFSVFEGEARNESGVEILPSDGIIFHTPVFEAGGRV